MRLSSGNTKLQLCGIFPLVYNEEMAAGGRSGATCTTTLPMLDPECRCSTASATDSRPLQVALMRYHWRQGNSAF